MAGKENIVGFLVTGSGVKQFQLSLGGWFAPEWSGSLSECRPTRRARHKLFPKAERLAVRHGHRRTRRAPAITNHQQPTAWPL